MAVISEAKPITSFLDLIAFSEGTSSSPITKNDGYDVIVSGIHGPQIFEEYDIHPFARGRRPIVVRLNPLLESTASGRYQLLLRYWAGYRSLLHYTDFSPLVQDQIAVELLKERHAIPMLLAGDIESAITACCEAWASFPGNKYREGGHSMETLVAKYKSF